MKKTVSICLTLWLGIAPTAFSAPLSEPEIREAQTGSVDYVDSKNRSVVIGDTKYVVGPNLTITTPSGGSYSFDSLKRGTKVGFITVPAAGSSWPLIVKMWLLPN